MTAVFDSGCKICTQFATVLRALVSPRDLDIVGCGTAIQKKIAPSVNEQCRDRFVLVDELGGVLYGPDAVRKAITMAPSLKRFQRLIDSALGKKIGEILYVGARTLRRKQKCCGGATPPRERR